MTLKTFLKIYSSNIEYDTYYNTIKRVFYNLESISPIVIKNLGEYNLIFFIKFKEESYHYRDIIDDYKNFKRQIDHEKIGKHFRITF